MTCNHSQDRLGPCHPARPGLPGVAAILVFHAPSAQSEGTPQRHPPCLSRCYRVAKHSLWTSSAGRLKPCSAWPAPRVWRCAGRHFREGSLVKQGTCCHHGPHPAAEVDRAEAQSWGPRARVSYPRSELDARPTPARNKASQRDQRQALTRSGKRSNLLPRRLVVQMPIKTLSYTQCSPLSRAA